MTRPWSECLQAEILLPYWQKAALAESFMHELTYLGETLRITPCMPTAIAPAEKKTSVLRFREQICQN